MAWASVPLANITGGSKHELVLKGGSPFNEEELVTQDDAKPAAA